MPTWNGRTFISSSGDPDLDLQRLRVLRNGQVSWNFLNNENGDEKVFVNELEGDLTGHLRVAAGQLVEIGSGSVKEMSGDLPLGPVQESSLNKSWDIATDVRVEAHARLRVRDEQTPVVMRNTRMDILGSFENIRSLSMGSASVFRIGGVSSQFESPRRNFSLDNLVMRHSTFLADASNELQLNVSSLSLTGSSLMRLNPQSFAVFRSKELSIADFSSFEITATNDIEIFGEHIQIKDDALTVLESNFANLTVQEEINVDHNASIHLASHTSVTTQRFFTDTNASILGIGRGYSGCKGPGSSTSVPGPSVAGREGGSHGGVGSFRDIGDDKGKMLTYGEVFYPKTLGSGGCDKSSTAGSSGGGSLHLVTHESCELHGSINLSGKDGSSFPSTVRYVNMDCSPY
jgi:hypothetical protein